jgi:hypothetical protein
MMHRLKACSARRLVLTPGVPWSDYRTRRRKKAGVLFWPCERSGDDGIDGIDGIKRAQ